MPQPTQNQVHVDSILTNISVAYMQSQDVYINQKVFPVVSVDKQSDLYFVYRKGDWFRDEAQLRADGVESAGSGYTLASEGYSARVWAIHKDVGPQVRQNYDNPLDADRDAARFVMNRLMLRQEVQWVNDYFKSGVWATDITLAAGLKWDVYATSNPAGDIRTAQLAMLQSTGLEGNTLIVGAQVDAALKGHPGIKDQFKYTSSASVTEDMIANYLGVGKYLVAKAVRNTAEEGAVDAMSLLFGKHALLVHAAPDPGLLVPSAGYTFMWKGISHGIGANLSIYKIPMDMLGLGTQRVEGQIAYVNKVVASDLGYFWNAVIT